MATSADVVSGENFASHFVKGNVTAADLQTDHIVLGNTGCFGHVDPVEFVHGLNWLDD